MKPFKFSLQRVLEIREKEEDLKKKAFGESRREFLDSQEVLFGMECQKMDCLKEAEVLPGNFVNLGERELFHHYLGFLSRKIEKQERDVKERETKMEAARDDWVSKRRERMVLEKLKDRKKMVYVKEFLKEEQYILDDIASTYNQPDRL